MMRAGEVGKVYRGQLISRLTSVLACQCQGQTALFFPLLIIWIASSVDIKIIHFRSYGVKNTTDLLPLAVVLF